MSWLKRLNPPTGAREKFMGVEEVAGCMKIIAEVSE